MIVYKTTNINNGKIYVGQDKYNNPKYLGSGFKLKRAIEKYGVKSFKKEILCYCKDKNDMNSQEKHWIKKLNSIDPNVGYNLVEGGQGGNLGNYANKKKSETLKKWIAENPEVRQGKNNGRYDHTIYEFYNYDLDEFFTGTKNDLALKTKSYSSAINAIVNKHRKSHKKWILKEFKDIYTKEYFFNIRSENAKKTIQNTIIKHGWKKHK